MENYISIHIPPRLFSTSLWNTESMSTRMGSSINTERFSYGIEVWKNLWKIRSVSSVGGGRFVSESIGNDIRISRSISDGIIFECFFVFRIM